MGWIEFESDPLKNLILQASIADVGWADFVPGRLPGNQPWSMFIGDLKKY
jgi:hypothetical protein